MNFGQQNQMYQPNQMVQPPQQMTSMNHPSTNWMNQPNWNRPMVQTVAPAVPTVLGIPGRAVANPQEIRPNEVPMDGTVGLFPMTDGSCILAKAWGPDGNIQTVRFVPEKSVEVAVQGPSEFDRVMERLESIEKLISSNQNRKSQYQNQKKEVTNNAE